MLYVNLMIVILCIKCYPKQSFQSETTYFLSKHHLIIIVMPNIELICNFFYKTMLKIVRIKFTKFFFILMMALFIMQFSNVSITVLKSLNFQTTYRNIKLLFDKRK